MGRGEKPCLPWHSNFKDAQPQRQTRDPDPAVGSPGSLETSPTHTHPQLPSQSHSSSQLWSTRPLILSPPITLNNKPLTSPSPSPFPRYGPAVPAAATPSGDSFLFGGLVRETVRNDLYLFSTRDLSFTLLQTAGERPSPRVGHASALTSSMLVVWGGDTLTTQLDNTLYLLNLVSHEWIRVTTNGPSPIGRYGHAASVIDSKFIVFGGQVNSDFLNDLWIFDLVSLQNNPTWELYGMAPGSFCPAKRTGHACITYGDQFIIFGGTDGKYHYNDTWAFNLNTRKWIEMQCTGFIPSPREGHAAAIVDDVIYVFGGRAVDGRDLDDLTALKISHRRWYKFQNMVPSPRGCSGHAMTSVGAKVLVLGGESFPQSAVDPNIIHVLNTKHITHSLFGNR